MVHVGTGLYLLLMFSVLWSILTGTVRAVKLLKLRKQIQMQERLPQTNDWEKKAWQYHFSSIFGVVLSVVTIFLFLTIVFKNIAYEDYIPQKLYAGNPPFATMEDFLPGGERKLVNMTAGNMNTVREWSDILAPVNFEWDEVAEIVHPDGRVLSGGLEVIYHETCADWIAARMAKEYFLKGKQEDDYEPLELSVEGMDYVVAYHSILHFPSVILQKGNKIIYARFYTSGKDSIRPELKEWAEVLAECLK